MIVTVTPNPSLDRTLEVTDLARGDVLRALNPRVEAGGKGINVARALHAHRRQVRAVLPAGGFEGRHLVALLEAGDIMTVVIAVDEPIRANISVVEPDGTTTKINEPGPCLSPSEIEDLLAAAEHEAAGADWVVGSGSLPAGAPDSFFAELTTRVRRAGARVAIDTSGQALAAAIAAGPDLVKPNLDELLAVTGLPVRTIADAIEAAQLVRSSGVHAVLASLGGDGALLVDDHGVLHAQRAVIAPRSTVGAGDATLAGFLAADGDDRSSALRLAVAFGSAAVELSGSQMPGPRDVLVDLVRVTDRPDLGRVLTPGSLPEVAPA